MDELNFLTPLIQTLGPAALAFGIMYLWLTRERSRVEDLEKANEALQQRLDRLHETRAHEQATQIAVLQQATQALRLIPSSPYSPGPSGSDTSRATSPPNSPPSYGPPFSPEP